MADEPTGNLHSTQGETIMDLFQKLNHEGTTIIQVTHNDRYAAYGKRIIRLKDGWMERERWEHIGQMSYEATGGHV